MGSKHKLLAKSNNHTKMKLSIAALFPLVIIANPVQTDSNTEALINDFSDYIKAGSEFVDDLLNYVTEKNNEFEKVTEKFKEDIEVHWANANDKTVDLNTDALKNFQIQAKAAHQVLRAKLEANEG